jgi:hypothetical protein
MRKALFSIAAVAVLLCICPAQESVPKRTFVTFEPLDTVTVMGNKPAPVEFTFHIQEGYHINSNKPVNPELIPTQLHFSLPGDLAIGKVQYPAGTLTAFPFDPDQKLSVYSGNLVIKALVMTPANSPTGIHTVHAELRYQACDNNACYPPKKLPIEFNVKIAKGSTKTHRKSK